MTPFQSRTGTPDQRWVKAKNVGTTLIPAWGAVEIVTISVSESGHLVYHVKRPTADNLNSDLVAFCGPTQIAATSGSRVGYGQVTRDFPANVLYETGFALAIGQSLGTQEDSFKLKRHFRGFACVGSSLGSGAAQRIPVINNPGAQSFIGVLTEELERDASAECAIWSGAGGAEVDSEVVIETFCWTLAEGETIAANTRVHGIYTNGVPYALAAACSPEPEE